MGSSTLLTTLLTANLKKPRVSNRVHHVSRKQGTDLPQSPSNKPIRHNRPRLSKPNFRPSTRRQRERRTKTPKNSRYNRPRFRRDFATTSYRLFQRLHLFE